MNRLPIQKLLTVSSHRGPRPELAVRARERLVDIDARIDTLQIMRAGRPIPFTALDDEHPPTHATGSRARIDSTWTG